MADISVELIDYMGDDLTVVNAARVSFDKESNWKNWEAVSSLEVAPQLAERDIKLIQYLADHNHWSPFAHAFLSFRIKAPIFVARQLQKHTVGLAWNEVSRRYVDDEPEFYAPTAWRKRAENVKQGSSDEIVETLEHPVHGDDPMDVNDYVNLYTEDMLFLYAAMIDQGIAPEQARMVLPQSTMTEWIWSGSLYAFARVCNLRLDSHAQRETQEVAAGIAQKASHYFPHSWSALCPTS